MSTLPEPPPVSPGLLRPILWGAAACLLLLPAVAMRLQLPGVQWSGGDFVAMGLLLGSTCALYELVVLRSGSVLVRAAWALALATAFLTLWVNLAVGMFGSPGDPRNLMCVGVLLVVAIGALRARFQPGGMQGAMAAAALAQVAVALAGLAAGAAGRLQPGGAGSAGEALLVAAFALPWLASALLFRRADAARQLLPR